MMKLKKIICAILAVMMMGAVTISASSCDVISGLLSPASSSNGNSGIPYEKLKMTTLGDSITDERNGKKYPYMIWETLDLQDIKNLGSSGATISTRNANNTLQTQATQVKRESNIISIFAGVNDYRYYHVPLGTKGHTDTDTFYGALDTLVQTLKSRCPNSYIFFITPLKCENYQKLNNAGLALEDYVNAIIDVCEDYGLDYFNAYAENDFIYDTTQSTVHKTDGLHPNYDYYKDVFTPKLKTFIETNYAVFYENNKK